MPDVNLQRLVVQLEAKVDKYEKALAKAQGTTKRSFSAMEASARSFNGTLAAIGVGFSLRAAQQLIDASTRITNSLKVAGLEGDSLTKVYESLFASAQRNAAPLEALVELYGRASLVQKELGISTGELLGFTDKVAVALRVSGKSAAESSGALLQLSQALGSGTIRAEEFSSILEGALPIAQAAAAGLKEAGGSVAKLRSLVVEGKVSSEAFFRAFEAGSSILEDKVANAELTVSQGFTRLANVMVRTAGDFDNATGLSQALGGGLDELASIIEKVGVAFRDAKPFSDFFFGGLASGFGQLEQWKEDLAKTLGLRGPGSLDDFLAGTNLLKGQIGFASQQNAGRDPAGPGASFSELAPFHSTSTEAKTVSLSDFKPPTGSSDAATKAIEKQRKAVLDLIDDLSFEKSLIGQTAIEQEIQNTIRQAGGQATDAQKNAIRSLLTEMDAEKKRIDANTEAMREFADISRAAIGGFVDDLLAGKSATEALGNALSKIAQSFLNKGIDLLVGSIFPGFADGGLVYGPGTGTSDSIPAMLSRGEYVMPAAAVKRIGVGNLDKMRGYANGGLVGGSRLPPLASEHQVANDNTTINFAPVINAGAGASRRDLDAALKQAKREFRDELPQMLADARRRGKM